MTAADSRQPEPAREGTPATGQERGAPTGSSAPTPRALMLSELYLPVCGGHVIWFHETARRLPGAAVLTARRPDQPAGESVEGVRVDRVDLSRRWYLRPESLALYVNFYRQAVARVRRERFEVLLSAKVLPEALVAGAVARRCGIASVVIAHGEEVLRNLPEARPPRRRRLTSAVKRRCFWRAYRSATRIIANSRYTRDLLIRGGIDPGKIQMVHPGTCPETFRPAPPDPELVARFNGDGRRVILTMGRLRERKGQDVVIRCMPEILRRHPDALYLIGGTGEHEQALRALIDRLGVGDSVRLLGGVAPGQLRDLYNLADVFVMPNRVMPGSQDVEGFGIVFLEAGACGLPVVAGRTGGVPDAVLDGQTGLLVDGADQADVTEAICRLLGDRELATRMGRAGRERVERALTWDHSAAAIAEVLAEAVAATKTDAGGRGGPGHPEGNSP